MFLVVYKTIDSHKIYKNGLKALSMPKLTITFADGSRREFETGTRIKDIIGEYDPGLIKSALAAKFDGTLLDLSAELRRDGNLEFLTFEQNEGKVVFWHSTAHLLAHAVKRLFPKAKPTIGPVIEEGGFYYDFDFRPFTPEDIAALEAEMAKLVEAAIPIERLELSKAAAKRLFSDNPYKLELIEEAAEAKLSAYRQADFVDLCRGPHVSNTAMLKAFKLTKLAAAYWRGDPTKPQLQRIYGISFPAKTQLEVWLKLQAEAAARDHRKLGAALELFSFNEASPGSPFWHPNGAIIWNELLSLWREEHTKAGYLEIRTPILAHESLWKRSGHWQHYKDAMYFLRIDAENFAIKPMNCPGAILVYSQRMHSYRELPLRLAELGLVHRHELSGALSGLFRVRAFTQDDSHIFVTEDQIESEIKNIITLIKRLYHIFGFDYDVVLSTKPKNAMGPAQLWDRAETALKAALSAAALDYKLNPGEGAFYGPKIDFLIKDALGRKWQCATIQLDFNLPERFELSYEGADGRKHRPVMIHRVVFGALERFIGILIEHYGGKFPAWLNPLQVIVLPISDRHHDYALEVLEKLRQAGLRAELDARPLTTPKKVREAQLRQPNYILVVGDKEVAAGTVNVRTRDNVVRGPVKVDEFVVGLVNEVKSRR